nr:hypothetical protein [Mesorhizobium sp.]
MTDEEIIGEEPTQMGKALAHRWLAQPDTGCRPAHAAFTEQGVEGDKQVQIDRSQIHAGPPGSYY